MAATKKKFMRLTPLPKVAREKPPTEVSRASMLAQSCGSIAGIIDQLAKLDEALAKVEQAWGVTTHLEPLEKRVQALCEAVGSELAPDSARRLQSLRAWIARTREGVNHWRKIGEEIKVEVWRLR